MARHAAIGSVRWTRQLRPAGRHVARHRKPDEGGAPSSGLLVWVVSVTTLIVLATFGTSEAAR
jgi:hypothetical protein